jgi:hypothetical protein
MILINKKRLPFFMIFASLFFLSLIPISNDKTDNDIKITFRIKAFNNARTETSDITEPIKLTLDCFDEKNKKVSLSFQKEITLTFTSEPFNPVSEYPKIFGSLKFEATEKSEGIILAFVKQKPYITFFEANYDKTYLPQKDYNNKISQINGIYIIEIILTPHR